VSFWTAVVAIVAIIAFANMRKARHHADAQAPRDADPAYAAALEREVAALRKRLEVLERIATEDRTTRNLANEIEQLRDQ
jgi:hypothetical protein